VRIVQSKIVVELRQQYNKAATNVVSVTTDNRKSFQTLSSPKKALEDADTPKPLSEDVFVKILTDRATHLRHYLLKAIRTHESRHDQVSGLGGYHVPIEQNEATNNQQNFSPRQNTKAGPNNFLKNISEKHMTNSIFPTRTVLTPRQPKLFAQWRTPWCAGTMKQRILPLNR